MKALRKCFIVIVAIIVMAAFVGCGDNETAKVNGNNASQTTTNTSKSTPSPSATPEVKERKVEGKATDLGAGTFQGGKDVPEGLYDVTAKDGSGNFSVNSSSGELNANEVLGNDDMSVKKIRVKISNGDKIEVQGINKVHFEPVTDSFVKTVQSVKLYSGRWVVGEDIMPGRYKATAPKGGGNFVVNDNNNLPATNEVLGEGGVKEVTVNLEKGNVIEISSLNEVDIDPVK